MITTDTQSISLCYVQYDEWIRDRVDFHPTGFYSNSTQQKNKLDEARKTRSYVGGMYVLTDSKEGQIREKKDI